jgi:hypothetical protein
MCLAYRRTHWLLTAVGAFAALCCAHPMLAATPTNLLENPSFEAGHAPWHLDKDRQTEAQFAVEPSGGIVGPGCARLTIGASHGWGTQFGQTLAAPAVGKTYTFAALVKSDKGSTPLSLQIERRGKPYDRAAASEKTVVGPDRWTELHVTFTLDQPFPQGWFAYLACQQANSAYCVDQFRLYEGEYVPYEQAARQALRAAAVSLFDTRTVSAPPLAATLLNSKPGWTRLAEDDTEHRFTGDAVLANDRMALVLRRGATGVELYARAAADFTLRARLAPRPLRDAKLESVTIDENSLAQCAVQAQFRTPRGQTAVLTFELATGQGFVRSEARAGATGLAVSAPARYLVLPDFFADDIVIDAAELPVATAELPSENFLLHLVPGGGSIVMTVTSQRAGDARVELSGQGTERQVVSTELEYGRQGKIWVAVLEAPALWHQQQVALAQAGKILPLAWKAPFPAQWRVDWRQSDRLTNSWEMLLQRSDGEFDKPGWLSEMATIPANRSRWNTVLGRFPYPCWIDGSACGFLQPLKSKKVTFDGPVLIFPIARVRGTPLDQYTVVDLVRATLGVGPCEYVLDVEGQGAAMKGRATCGTRDALKPIYKAGQQRQRRAEIEKILQDVVIFVTHIRSRIDQYVAFGRQTDAWLAAQQQAHPELKPFLDEMRTLAQAMEADFEKRKENIRTPQYVIDLTNEFRRNVMDYEGPDALERCNKITNAIVVVGGNQDELVGECRRDVRVLRQRAALAAAAHPQAVAIAKELRHRTQDVLRNAASYEAPRH